MGMYLHYHVTAILYGQGIMPVTGTASSFTDKELWLKVSGIGQQRTDCWSCYTDKELCQNHVCQLTEFMTCYMAASFIIFIMGIVINSIHVWVCIKLIMSEVEPHNLPLLLKSGNIKLILYTLFAILLLDLHTYQPLYHRYLDLTPDFPGFLEIFLD